MENEDQGIEQEQQEAPDNEQERMAAFEAGLSGKRSTETPIESEQPAEETAAEPAAPEPRYRQITEDEFAELNARAAKVTDLEQTLKRDRDAIYGTIGGLQRSINSRQAISLPKEKLEALRNDLPEVAELLDAVAQATAAPSFDQDAIVKSAEERLKPAFDQIEARAEQNALRRLRAELLSEVHPKWKEEAESDEFAAFAKAQGAEFMNRLAKASNDWDHRVIGAALSSWKDSKKAASASANARRERLASNVNPRGSAAPSEAPPTRDEAFTAGLRKVGATR
jgi:hypothetical protein